MKLGSVALKWKITVTVKNISNRRYDTYTCLHLLNIYDDMKNVALTKSIESWNTVFKLEQVMRSE